jgi:hypothetical protein
MEATKATGRADFRGIGKKKFDETQLTIQQARHQLTEK